MWDAEVDVVVAGAGGCGLVAALSVAEKSPDLEVVVFEKTDHVLGNTAASAGMIPAADTRFQREKGFFETPEMMAEDIMKKNHYTSDPELTLRVCKASGPLVEWINDSVGLPLSIVTEIVFPGQSTTRMHATASRSGLELMKGLQRKVSELENIYLMKRSEVVDLIVDENNAVIGVKVHTPDGIQSIKANKVILATNGFGSNKQMVQKHIPEIAEAIYFGYEANTGDAIRMTEKLDAALVNMQGYQGHGSISEAHGIVVTWTTIMLGGFMVNENGQRFGNETSGYSEYATMVLNQPGKHGYIIFDQEILNRAKDLEDFRSLLQMNAFETGHTIEELAAKLKLPEQVHSTYADFMNNENGVGDQFGRSNFAKKLKAPLYGIKTSPALFHTQGGLNINTNAQVLNKQGEPISNLYAGGGAAVGISGNEAFGYSSGNGLLTALGFGRIAGNHAAATLLGEESHTT
jgi:fumarate reductase flavoprotein subunit